MKELFKGLMEMEDVKGIFLFSMDGKLTFQDTKEPLPRPIEEEKWLTTLNVAKDLDEIEFVYDYEKIYMRRTENGLLIIRMRTSAPLDMVKMNCNILLMISKKFRKQKI